MRAVLARRDARWYLAAQVLSLFADSTLWLAAGIWVKQLTGSASAAGLVFFFVTLPYAAAPVFGLIADRLPRRPLMIGVNLASALVVLGLLGVRGEGQLWLVYLVIFWYGVGGALLGPAQSAFLTELLPPALLGDANAVLQTGREGLRLFSPLIGAGVVAWLGTAAPIAVFDAVTFVVAAAVLAGLKGTPPAHPEPAAASGDGWWADVSAGLKHVWSTVALRRIVVAAALAVLVVGFQESIIFPVAERGLGRSTSFVGVLLTVQAVGAVAGGALSGRALRRWGDGRTLVAGLILYAAGVALLLPGQLPIAMAGMVIEGAGIPLVVVAFGTAVQLRSPAHLQGRAYAAADMMATIPQTLSIAAGAALVAVADFRLLLTAVVVVVAAAAGWLAGRLEPRPGAVDSAAVAGDPATAR